jgi:hypothetical protein
MRSQKRLPLEVQRRDWFGRKTSPFGVCGHVCAAPSAGSLSSKYPG